ncbi:MAG TPA: glutaredoxin family protein [Tepidisphaeraceae bacterium]
MNRVTIYSKPDCHLCDVMKQIVQKVRRRREFELEIRNILDDLADFEKYQTLIPLLLVNGSEIARYRIREDQLEAALRE